MGNRKLDIIDQLDGVEGYVKIILKNGIAKYGQPETIFYKEDKDGWETIKRLAFTSYPEGKYTSYGLEDIESFEPVKEEDIPPHE